MPSDEPKKCPECGAEMRQTVPKMQHRAAPRWYCGNCGHEEQVSADRM